MPDNDDLDFLNDREHHQQRQNSGWGGSYYDSNGWYVYDGPRDVQVTLRLADDTSAGMSLPHSTLLEALYEYHRNLDGTDVINRAAAKAVYALVISDLETGTSVRTWPYIHELVDVVLKDTVPWILPGAKAVSVHTEWQGF